MAKQQRSQQVESRQPGRGAEAGRVREWGPDQLARLRTELIAAYRMIDRDLGARADVAADGMRRFFTEAGRVLTTAAPRWLSTETLVDLRGLPPTQTYTDDLLALGECGLLVFGRPVCRTAFGASLETGLLPVDGALWWTAALQEGDPDLHDQYCGDEDCESFDPDSPGCGGGLEPASGEDAQLIMVHVLSRGFAADEPWAPEVWEGCELHDLGVMPLPIGQPMIPAAGESDDAWPLLETLTLAGSAVELGDARLDDCVRGTRAGGRRTRGSGSVLPRPQQLTVQSACPSVG